MIDKALGLACPDPAETYSSSPHLYEELGIPTDTKGTVGDPQKTQTRRAPAEKAEKPERNRTRNRRRTRGGQSTAGHPEAATGQAESAADDTSADGASPAKRRRRRRPRKAAAANAG
jgi:hypothetical protein